MINLIEYLPGNVIVDLLLHLLVLLECDFFFIVLESVSLVFFVDFAMQLLSDLFKFVLDLAVEIMEVLVLVLGAFWGNTCELVCGSITVLLEQLRCPKLGLSLELLLDQSCLV